MMNHIVEDDEDNEDFVPESLRGFLQAAEDKLNSDIDDVLNFDFLKTPQDAGVAAETASNYQAAAAAEVAGTEESTDFLSPQFNEMMNGNNPAANLTESQAKNMAMEGATPLRIDTAPAVNLQKELDDAAKLFTVEETEGPSSNPMVEQQQQQPPPQTEPQATPDKPRSTPRRKDSAKKRAKLARSMMLAKVSPEKDSKSDVVDSPSKTMDVDTIQPSTPSRDAVKKDTGSPVSVSKVNVIKEIKATTPVSASPEPVTSRPIPTDKGINGPATKAMSTEQHPNALKKRDNLEPRPQKGRKTKPTQVQTPSPASSKPHQRSSPQQLRGQLPAASPQRQTLGAQMRTPSPAQPKQARRSKREKATPSPGQSPKQEEPLQSPRRSPPDRPRQVTIPSYGSALDSEQVLRPAHSTSMSSTSFDNNEQIAAGTGYITPMQNISPIKPRLLHGTASSPARNGPIPAIGNRRRQLTSPDKMSSRLLRGTNASKARLPKRIGLGSTAMNQGPKRPSRIVTSLVPVSSRLLKGTAASDGRFAKSPPTSIVSPSAEAGRKAAKARIRERMKMEKKQREEREKERQALILSPTSLSPSAEEGREAAKERVRERMKMQKKRQSERDKEIQERILLRQRQALERKEKIQATLDRAKLRRERLAAMERERVAKLKRTIAEKEAKAKQRELEKEKEKENRLLKSVSPKPKLVRPRTTPTIPLAPKFATDSRVKKRETPPRQEVPPLAAAIDILRKGLRDDGPVLEMRSLMIGGKQGRSSLGGASMMSSGERSLTIPQGPKLATSVRHGMKTPVATPNPKENARVFWQSGLRDVSSPTSTVRSSAHKLTIPVTPKFQPIRRRSIAKSTAQKEQEVMEYYKAHPFKANPIRMNDLGSALKPKNPVVPRQLTLPEPFYFQTDSRVGKATPDPQGEKQQLFKARPMPDFSSRSNPLTQRTPSTRRPLTTPEPFKLQTHQRATHGKSRGSPPQSKFSTFRARQMPDFSKQRVPVSQRQPLKRTPGPKKLEAEEEYHFRARPMPDFYIVSPPGETPEKAKQQSPEIRSPDSVTRPSQENADMDDSPLFKARPMPTFVKAKKQSERDQNGDKSMYEKVRERMMPNKVAESGRVQQTAFSTTNVKDRLQVLSQLLSPEQMANAANDHHAGESIPPEEPVVKQDDAHVKQMEEERLRRLVQEDTIKMAYQLQHAAEEELSFHGSVLSGSEKLERGIKGYNEYM